MSFLAAIVSSSEVEAYRTAVLLGTGITLGVYADPVPLEAAPNPICDFLSARGAKCSACRSRRAVFRLDRLDTTQVHHFPCLFGSTCAALALRRADVPPLLLWAGVALHTAPTYASFDQVAVGIDPPLDPLEHRDLSRVVSRIPVVSRTQLDAVILGFAYYVGRAASAPAAMSSLRSFDPVGLVRRVQDCVDLCYAEPIGVREIAARLGVDESHLGRVFRRQTGNTMTRYLAETRVAKAAELLAQSRRRITEIAMATGFSSITRFNVVFKKIAGVPPSLYRARHLIEQIRSHGSAALIAFLSLLGSDWLGESLAQSADWLALA